ncbi:MAG: DUF7405 family protein [Acidimicrobiales bacterium]
MTTVEQNKDAAFDWGSVVDYSGRYAYERPVTQYELPGVTEELHVVECTEGGDHKGVPVAVVPLWHAMVTARLNIDRSDPAALKEAKTRLDTAVAQVEELYPVSPAGILPQIAWGLPYFSKYIPASLVNEHMPKSTREGTQGEAVLIDAISFPRDPDDIVLEHNDVCFHLKSDFAHHVDEVLRALFFPGDSTLNGVPARSVFVGDLFTVTSVRRGFAGHGMPKRMGLSMGIPGAEKIPSGAMLFMGFTSSHVHGLAAGNLPSYETLPGWTDATPASYMAGGSNMHVSHIAIELDRWYDLNHRERLHRMFTPRRDESEEVLSPDQCPATSTFRAQRDEDVERFGLVGHNEQMQFLSRLEEETTTAYGQVLPKGTVFFLRQDFDTTENPFEFSVEGAVSTVPRAGVHFIGMGPSSQHFHLMRKEMDSPGLAEEHNLPDENVGFTDFLVNTHRQNFCLPPRAHRSFPLAELL